LASHTLVLFFAPLLCWLPELPYARKWLGPRVRVYLRLALVALPVIVVLILAQQNFAHNSAQTSTGSQEPSIQDYMDYRK